MSDTTTSASDAPRPVLPTHSLYRLDETSSATPRPSRRRSKTESSVRRAERVQWVDVDEATSSPRRKKRASQNSTTDPLKGQTRSRNSTESELGRFLPRVARILESGESSIVSSSKTRRRSNPDRGHRSGPNDTPSRRSGRSTETNSSLKRSTVKHKVGNLHRRADLLPKINPSLLSVLSSLTRASDHSSSSGTTITQESYDQKAPRRLEGSDRNRDLNTETELPEIDDQPNVYDYIMDAADSDDARSVRSSSSSSSSHYEASIASSNEVPGSPSSHSTYGSPTSTRNSSLVGSIGVAELRSKFDSQNISSIGPGSRGSLSPKVVTKSAKKSSQAEDIPEDEDEDEDQEGPSDRIPSYDEVVFNAKKHSETRSVKFPSIEGERLKQQQDAMRHHVAESQQYARPTDRLGVDSAYGPRRSSSSSSAGSSESQRTWQEYVAMQQYHYQQQHQQHPTSPLPVPHSISNVEKLPPAPDAPDLTQTTLTGYELLARQLTTPSSPIKPIYRTFSYLNHRLLLHMQDELQDMEETLRIYDEIIAQTERDPATKEPVPASRRRNGKEGSEVHFRRTMLLGEIFRKMGQYREKLRELGEGEGKGKGLRKAEGEEVRGYREWMRERGAVVDGERRFLDEEGDLVVPCEKETLGRIEIEERRGSGGGGIVVEPRVSVLMVMLPMLLGAGLVSLVTSRGGCVVLMILAAVGAGVVYFKTGLGPAGSRKEELK